MTKVELSYVLGPVQISVQLNCKNCHLKYSKVYTFKTLSFSLYQKITNTLSVHCDSYRTKQDCLGTAKTNSEITFENLTVVIINSDVWNSK